MSRSGVSIMMGDSDPQRSMFYKLSLESFVPELRPLRRIRPLIVDIAIQKILTCPPKTDPSDVQILWQNSLGDPLPFSGPVRASVGHWRAG